MKCNHSVGGSCMSCVCVSGITENKQKKKRKTVNVNKANKKGRRAINFDT